MRKDQKSDYCRTTFQKFINIHIFKKAEPMYDSVFFRANLQTVYFGEVFKAFLYIYVRAKAYF